MYGRYYIRRLRSIVRSKHGGALKAKYFYMTEHGMRKEDIDNGDSAKKEQN